MIGAAQRYRELLFDLVLQRALAGGSLVPTDEARLVAELDRCWTTMTDEEQDELERSLAEQAPPSAPDSLAEEDRAVGRGSRLPPRKAA